MTNATEIDTRRNGTAAVAMPIKTVAIGLDDVGYPGWVVTMRINPRASVYDELVSGDLDRWWKGVQQVVLDWNFASEDGTPIPLPKEVEAEKALDLPVLLMAHLLDRYFEAVRAAAAVPKAPNGNSEATSSTSDGDQKRE